jgi:hypothetical protein
MNLPNIVLGTIEDAYAWVRVCSESLWVSKGIASLILTHLCGYETWYEMAADIGTQPPTPIDEAISDDALAERHERYVAILVDSFEFDIEAAVMFVSSLSPSSSVPVERVFLPFTAAVHFEWDEDEDEDEGIAEDLLAHLADAARQSFPEELDAFANALRLSGEINPHVWYNTLATLGWPVVDETFNESPDIGVPAFMVDDPKHGMTPIYVSSVVRSPADDADGAAIATMAATKAAIVRSQGLRGYGLLFWKYPQTNNVNGVDYCYVGMLYSGKADQWEDMFLKFGCTSAAELIALHEASSPDFSPALVDKDRQLFWGITLNLHEIESHETDIEVIEMRSPSNWMMAMMSRKQV